MSGAIWLASYPRSGNTWSRLALLSARQGGVLERLDEVYEFGTSTAVRARVDELLEFDTGLLPEKDLDNLRPDYNAAMAEMSSGIPLKVHDAWERASDGRAYFDASFTSAAIYLIRDPRDVAVSWARFMDQSIDAAIDFMDDPQAGIAAKRPRRTLLVGQHMGRWSDHVASWVDQSGLDPLVIRYEDMLRDPAAALAAMTARLGWTCDGQAIDRAVAATRFDRLADLEARDGFSEKSIRTERFFHTGRAGTWRDMLTPDQANRIEKAHGDMMARYGYR